MKDSYARPAPKREQAFVVCLFVSACVSLSVILSFFPSLFLCLSLLPLSFLLFSLLPFGGSGGEMLKFLTMLFPSRVRPPSQDG